MWTLYNYDCKIGLVNLGVEFKSKIDMYIYIYIYRYIGLGSFSASKLEIEYASKRVMECYI